MRAARAQQAAPVEQNGAVPVRVPGNFPSFDRTPHGEASVAASNISYCFCKDIESWCPYVGETMGAQLNMGVLDDLP